MQQPDDISIHLAPVVKAALSWVNESQGTNYSLTGLVDVDDVDDLTRPFEFGLVLCDGELCMRAQLHVTPDGNTFQFGYVEEAAPDIPPLLDPPPGIRSEWLDRQLQKYEFILLLYYRGLW